jgi:hypothetical protein
MSTARSAALLVIVCACSDDAAPRDAATPDIDNGVCGSLLRFTGEYVDWDSGASFCGILGAQFAVPGGAQGTTPPNGRFDLCVPDQAVVLVDITPPTAASQCTVPPATYTLPGIAVASKAVILAGGFWSGRGFAMARQSRRPGEGAGVRPRERGAPAGLARGDARTRAGKDDRELGPGRHRAGRVLPRRGSGRRGHDAVGGDRDRHRLDPAGGREDDQRVDHREVDCAKSL